MDTCKRLRVHHSSRPAAEQAASRPRQNRLYPVYNMIEDIYDTINYNYDNQLLNILTYKSIRPVYGENGRMPGVFLRLKRSRALTSSLDQCGAMF